MTRPECNCGVSKGLRSDHEAECQGAYIRSSYVGTRKFLTCEELEKLTTARLLAYKNKLYKVPDGPSHEEMIYGGIDTQMHKLRSEWKAALADVKAVLAAREHVGGTV